jgi:hypothetical protein
MTAAKIERDRTAVSSLGQGALEVTAIPMHHDAGTWAKSRAEGTCPYRKQKAELFQNRTGTEKVE